ncbi:MAG TPA: phytoene/squalene synthase family protein [Euzebyales bacterium]|nr:phytoene/squalene synthase family protein [Euzebyales bacterium]
MTVHEGVPGYRHPAPSTAIVADGLPDDRRVDLATSYELCRRLNAAHGRTYYFATRFLPRHQRHHVHALYGFARYADDLVDHFDLDWSDAQRRAALEAWSADFLACLDRGHSDDPVLKAVVATVYELGIAHDDLRAFLRSMAMDLTVIRYDTYEDLYGYMYGSAAVIGAMMLPVLGGRHPDARARAMDLGIAFQLTNFLRDVAEDWDRGRIYLPQEDLARFDVSEDHFRRRRVTPQLRSLLAFEIDRTRMLYRRAEEGWGMLAPRSQACIRIAHRLYGEILDRIEATGYQVFDHRASVPTPRRLAVAGREVLRRPRPVPQVRAA